jgi:hypothetical protein
MPNASGHPDLQVEMVDQHFAAIQEQRPAELPALGEERSRRHRVAQAQVIHGENATDDLEDFSLRRSPRKL